MSDPATIDSIGGKLAGSNSGWVSPGDKEAAEALEAAPLPAFSGLGCSRVSGAASRLRRDHRTRKVLSSLIVAHE